MRGVMWVWDAYHGCTAKPQVDPAASSADRRRFIRVGSHACRQPQLDCSFHACSTLTFHQEAEDLAFRLVRSAGD